MLAVALHIAGCRSGRGNNVIILTPTVLSAPEGQYAAARRGELLAPGRLVGKVGRFDGQRFQAAAGVEVWLDDGGIRTVTDGAGYYGFERVGTGLHRVSLRSPEAHPMVVSFRANPLTGLGRVNLPLIPLALTGEGEKENIALAGIVTDPRGAALPGGTVRLVDSLTEVGNWSARADEDGFWSVTLKGVRRGVSVSGVANMTAYGRTPGGIQVETVTVQTLGLDASPTHALIAGTTAFGVPQSLAWASTGNRQGVLQGESMPQRRDEVMLRFRKGETTYETLPTETTDRTLSVQWPAAFEAPGTVEVLPLGLVPPQAAPPSVPVP
ncbi:MAG: hypothetical protein VKP62_11100 [Candidatus Sericytochromatia bacterium]|nr:hypothetical protein [Candidatus Sericytochromatia bacterium]